MNILINQILHTLATDATLADAIAALQPRPPFAAAVNLQFVPKPEYAHTALHDDDRIDIIAPVTGG
jgi:sulfur carrier protein